MSRLRCHRSLHSHRLVISPYSHSVATTIRGRGAVFGKRWIPRQQIHHEGKDAATGAQTRTRTPHRGTCAHDDASCLPRTPFCPRKRASTRSTRCHSNISNRLCPANNATPPRVRQRAARTAPDAPANTSSDRIMKKKCYVSPNKATEHYCHYTMTGLGFLPPPASPMTSEGVGSGRCRRACVTVRSLSTCS